MLYESTSVQLAHTMSVACESDDHRLGYKAVSDKMSIKQSGGCSLGAQPLQFLV